MRILLSIFHPSLFVQEYQFRTSGGRKIHDESFLHQIASGDNTVRTAVIMKL